MPELVEYVWVLNKQDLILFGQMNEMLQRAKLIVSILAIPIFKREISEIFRQKTFLTLMCLPQVFRANRSLPPDSKRGFVIQGGNLFFEIIRIVEEKRPRIILLENVENIVEHDNQKTFLTIFNSLSECGYDVKYRTLQPFDYAGIPQRRKRVFIVAFRDIDDCDAFSFPKEMEEKQAIDRIIDFSQKQHTSYYYENNHPSYPELEQKAKIGKIYSLKNDGSVYCSGTLCPTLIAGMGKFPDRIPVVKDNYGIRRLTIRECLRFQGFPDNFNISRDNSIEDAYKQIGNSVCVPIVNRIAIEIAKVLERKVL